MKPEQFAEGDAFASAMAGPFPAAPPPLAPLTLAEFLAREFPPREMLLAPWLPRQGLAMIYAARGVGMTDTQRLFRVELPLASPVILAGIRLSVVISLATATIGSTVAAATLGEVIIAGLTTNNMAFVVQGGVIVGVLAVLIYDALLTAERALARRTGTASALGT